MASKRLSQGFFSGDETPDFVDVGRDEFCAVAAGIIDNFLSHQYSLGNARMKDLLNRVLIQHYSYFPKHQSCAIGLNTPYARMQQLLVEIKMSELLPALAYTLRQIAVDAMISNPARYCSAFLNNMPLDVMRQPGILLGASAIAALADALGMSIEVEEVDCEKELPKRTWYNQPGRGK